MRRYETRTRCYETRTRRYETRTRRYETRTQRQEWLLIVQTGVMMKYDCLNDAEQYCPFSGWVVSES